MTPQTFLIKSENPYLLKALVEDLVKAGYKSSWGRREGYNSISSNIHNDVTNPDYKRDWQLFISDMIMSQYDKTFTLPQDYQQAFNFAVEQLQIVNDIIRVEEKTGRLIPTKVYWSNNEIYPKGFIWRYKDIKTVAYIDSYSMLLINEETFKTNIGLNDRGWENIRKATAKEIKWLEACEKANKYVPLEEVNKPQFPFKKGDYCTSFDQDGIWQIFKFDKIDEKRIDCIDYLNTHVYAYYHDWGCAFDTNVTYKPSTPEEIQWLDACIRAGDFISKEDAIKPKFKVGKWYEINYPSIDKKFIVKAPNNWMCTNNIENKVYYPDGSFPNNKIILREVSIEEIQQYLPDGHEDKIIKYTLEEGEYYKVVEDDFWMIGKVSKGNNGNNADLLLRGTCHYYINYGKAYYVDANWCYYDEDYGEVIRNFTKLSKDSDEVKWLEACHKAGKYLTKEEALNPKPSIKVGDIVVVTKQISGNKVSVGSVVKIVEIDDSSIPYKTEDYYKLHEWGLSYSWCNDVRLATQEEINKALLNKAKKDYPIGTHFKSAYKPDYPRTYTVEKDYYSWYRDGNIVVNHKLGPSIYCNGNWAEIVESKPEIKTAKFGEVTFTIEGNNDYATTKYGKVTKGSIENAVNYLKNPLTLAGFNLTIHTENDYEKISNVNMLFKIGFGCQSGTLQELENILKCFS